MSETQVSQLQKNYEAIRQNAWLDKRLIYILARSFVDNPQQFDYSTYKALKKSLKEKLGAFHLLQAPISDAIVILLMANKKTDESDLEALLANYQLLLEYHFKRSSYTYFAAFLMLLSTGDQSLTAQRGQDIYQAIRQDHPWITTAEDAPMALTLALQPYLNKQEPLAIAATTESYYQNLKKAGFNKYTDLQYAAACCTNYFGSYQESAIQQIAATIDGLKAIDFTINHAMYIAIVSLAFVGQSKPVDFQQIKANEQLIKERGKLRFDRSIRQLLAINLYTSQELHDQENRFSDQMDALNISLMIIQEQVAATAAITAAVVTSSSSN